MSDVIVAPETRELGQLAASLKTWIADRNSEYSDIRLENLTYPRGAGQSHETILFDLSWREAGRGHSQGCVVRIKPRNFTVFPDDLFDEQYRLMKLMSDGGYVPVAKPMWFEESATVLGAAFFIMEKKQGRVPVSIPPYSRGGWLAEAAPGQRRVLWENAVRQLAAIQRVPIEQADFLEGPAYAKRGLAQEWDKYRRFVAWLQEDEDTRRSFGSILEASLARLDATKPADQPDGLVWGDARIGNMMFDDNFEVIAVMDWEQPSLGGALQDLAWFNVLSETMHGRSSTAGTFLEGMGTRDETIALWEQVSGKSAVNLEWHEQFAKLKMSCTGIRLGQLRGTYMMTPQWMKERLQV